MENWKSPRKVEEEKRLYVRKRFEHFLSISDLGILERHIAIQALREELVEAGDMTDCPTEALDLAGLRFLLDQEGQ